MSPGRLAVIGWPLGHTLSPVFQQTGLDALGIEAEYVAAPTPPDELHARLEELRSGLWDGLNVTVPHKLRVAELVDRRTPAAERLGAVNTVSRQAPGLLGDNTDIDGFARALQVFGHFHPHGQSVVVLGAGGAARAAAWALADAGASRITLANRTERRAHDLAAALTGAPGRRMRACGLGDPALRRAIGEATLLVNTTSLGMQGGPAPDESPVPAAWLHPKLLVFDIVYRPSVTPLLAAAAGVGCATLGGLEMLVLQGAASLERWTGRRAPVGVMLRAARTALDAPVAVRKDA